MNHIPFPFSSLFIAAAALLAAGCSGSSSAPPGQNNPPVAGLLRAAASADELETAIKAGLTTVPAESAASPFAASDAGGAAPGSFTGSYTQEVAVDEFDTVRYDGEHLYVAPRRYVNCCFFVTTDGASATNNPPLDSIRILSTDAANASAAPVAEIPLEQNVSVQGLYVEGERLFALTAESTYGTFGPFWADLSIWAPETLGYQVFDTSDKSNPVLEAEVTIDGIFVDSRRIGNTVYIVSRYAPDVQGLVYSPADAAQAAQNQATLASTTLDDLLPRITVNGTEQQLVDPAQCYLTNDDTTPAHSVITNVTAVPIDDPAAFTNTCYNASAYGAYVSANAIYFTEVSERAAATATRIHKFALSGTAVQYRGSGEVAGQVWRGGQADFRMSEHNGDLRVFSSDFDWNNTDTVDHYLFVLREATGARELEIVGQLPNDANPQPIGKPNEQLYGVRFLSDRAYAVTFEQIDPLYVFDLADPTDPVIAGELEVPGFSDFLHPVTDDLLLGLGSDANGGVKLELFDVSDMTAPLSRGQVILGEAGAYSEARWDRHAFTWQPDVNGVDRFAIPAALRDGGVPANFQTSLYLFEIRDKTMPGLASLSSVGNISPPTDGNFPWTDRNRAFINGDAVYYLQDERVWSAFWTTPALLNGPF